MATTLFTITFLLVCAVALVFAIPMVRQQTQRHNEAIRAEVWATDILDESVSVPQKTEPKKSSSTVYRWDRIAIFAAGSASLLIAIITGILAPFTAVAWYVPFIFFGVTVASLATLRYLALQDAKKRAKRRPVSKSQQSVSQVVLKPQKEEPKSKVQPSESGAPQVKPIKHSQQKPINFASKSLRYARTHHQDEPVQNIDFKKLPSGSIELEQQENLGQVETWDVRETPRPTYLDAAVSFTNETTTLDIAEPEKSESATLKEAAVKAYGMDLDDVLSRRRAQ